MEQFGDKTHDATPHRRKRAREDGQVPKSQDLISAGLLVCGVLTIQMLGGKIANYFLAMTENRLSDEPLLHISVPGVAQIWNQIASGVGRVVMPLFVAMFVLAIAFNVGQVGFLFLPKKLAPDWSRLSPWKGVKRIFSLQSFTRLGFGMFKLLVVTAVAGVTVGSRVSQILHIGNLDTIALCSLIVEIILTTCLRIGIALLVLALLDYLFQRWKHEQDLKMTTQEVRDEMKTLEGDQHVKARRRVIQRQLVINRIQSAVPESDVVVTNPTELAIAIKYDMATMPAPIVVAKGAGILAQHIRRLALENNVPIVERKPLAQALYKQVDVNETIPHEQYAAVAEVLRYVYELKGINVPQ